MAKSGTFVAILVFNVFILVLLGSTVIYRFVVSQEPEPLVTFKIKPVPPPPKPPAHGGNTAKSLADPTVAVVPPPVSLPSIVLTTAPSTLSFHASSIPTLSSALPSLAVPSGIGLGQGSSGGGSPQTNPFGSAADSGTSGLVGYFYDLKQTSGDSPTPSGMTKPLWRQEMLRLVADNLNEDDLSKYFKSPAPLSTGGLAIPEQSSTNAPIAFNLNNVQPNLWAIIYRGKASIPEAGRYRFVGLGDDLLYVRINGKEVFDGGWIFVSQDSSLHDVYRSDAWKGVTGGQFLRKGAWFTAEQGDVVNIDILIGDWGGLCGYNLLLEKEGVSYEMTPDNSMPKLPYFQVGATLPPPTGRVAPLVSENGVVWPAVGN